MLSRNNYFRIWKTALLPIVDFVSIFLGVSVVYLIRYKWFEDNFFGDKQLPLRQFVFLASLTAITVIVVYVFLGEYEIYKKRKLLQTSVNLALGILTVLVAIIAYFFFNEYNRENLPNGVPVSRFVLATGGIFAYYSVILGRSLFWALEQILYQFNIGKINIAVVGAAEERLLNEITKASNIGGMYRYDSLDNENLTDIENKIKTGQISEIYLFGSGNKLETKLATICERYKASFIFSPEGFSQFQSFGLKPILIRKKLFLELIHSNLDGWQFILKRLFDILFSLTFMVLFSWLYLLIALAIKIDSKGTIFYLSERTGPDGKVFKLFKFRRLKQEFCTTEDDPEKLKLEAELIAKQNLKKDNVLYKIKNDPRSTSFGKFIEKYSLDELPQFLNVFLGNMSLVGPRPHQPREVAKYTSQHYKVLNIKPGITGFAQINGRSDLTFEQEVEFDTYYIEHWSFWLDLLIIFKTPFIVLFGKHGN